MNDETTSNSAIAEEIGFAPLGEVFVAARNAKELTQKDVSNNLRISIKQVNALENNDFSSLPQAVITRGFIRNYARLLDVDAEPLLASYRTRTPEASPSVLTVQTSTRQVLLSKPSQPWLKYILAIILISLLLLGWFFSADFMPKPVNKTVEKVDAAVAANTMPDSGQLPEIALPAAERLPENTEPATEPAGTDEALGSSVEVILPDVAQITQQAETTQATQSAQAGVTNATESATKIGNAILATKNVRISVSEETWVRISDKSGAIVYEKLLTANSTDGFDGLPPLQLWIGNAKATTLTFLGKPVDLTGATKSNVARITLE
ncbi:MAG: DUF4115 domain-containing protein [Betaproteobacteria bacterium HGW-Betaproteobacteria-20]|nr:MAG: DUF4115 domain-containing protein [Betaproteobacteria bacterium HGW-Betaproteobacteria-20]